MRKLTRMFVCIGMGLAVMSAGALAAKKEEKKNDYPNATRKDPKNDLTAASQKDVNKALELVNDEKYDEAQPLLQKVIDDPKAGNYAHALALEGEAQIAHNKQDDTAAIKYFHDAYALEALPNNEQFGVLYNTAVIQIQAEKYQDALTTLDEFFKVTGSQKADAYALQGNAYYRLEKYQQAIDSMKKALSLTDKPTDSWNQILMASYAELDQYDEAAKILEAQRVKDPNDAKLATQLATVYLKGKQDQKAIAVMADAKQKGLITTEKDYKLMAQLYDQADQAKQGAAVLQEGFDKGIIKPDFEMYKLLGDSYALANDEVHAIDAYGNASALAQDGNVDYIRGSLLMNNDRNKEAVVALKLAVSRGGLKQPGEVYILLGDALNNEDDTKDAIAAWTKAKGYPSSIKMADQRLKNQKGGHGAIIKKATH